MSWSSSPAVQVGSAAADRPAQLPPGFSAQEITLSLDGGHAHHADLLPNTAATGIQNATLRLSMVTLRWTLPVRILVRDPIWADMAPLLADENHYRMTLTNNTTQALPVSITVAGGVGDGTLLRTRLASPTAPVTLMCPPRARRAPS